MKNKFIPFLLFIACYFTVYSQDTTYVKSSELEPNKGLWEFIDPYGDSVDPFQNSYIEIFRISPDGRYIAYLGYSVTDSYKTLNFYDIRNNKIIFFTFLEDLWSYSYWFRDSVNVIYDYSSAPDSNGHFSRKLLRLNLKS